MAFNYVVVQSVNTGSEVVQSSKTYSAGAESKITETVAQNTTDKQINIAIDVSAVKAIYILSDYAMILQTNSGSSPADTLTLVANVPYIWTTDSYDVFKFGTDVTAIFATTGAIGTTDATLQIRVLYDPTP
jgi:hypothetical protein